MLNTFSLPEIIGLHNGKISDVDGTEKLKLILKICICIFRPLAYLEALNLVSLVKHPIIVTETVYLKQCFIVYLPRYI